MRIRFFQKTLLGQSPHGPASFPWWRLFGLRVCRVLTEPPTTSYRLWIYLRSRTWFADVVFDRRQL